MADIVIQVPEVEKIDDDNFKVQSPTNYNIDKLKQEVVSLTSARDRLVVNYNAQIKRVNDLIDLAATVGVTKP
jgi:hypothetical protein